MRRGPRAEVRLRLRGLIAARARAMSMRLDGRRGELARRGELSAIGGLANAARNAVEYEQGAIGAARRMRVRPGRAGRRRCRCLRYAHTVPARRRSGSRRYVRSAVSRASRDPARNRRKARAAVGAAPGKSFGDVEERANHVGTAASPRAGGRSCSPAATTGCPSRRPTTSGGPRSRRRRPSRRGERA